MLGKKKKGKTQNLIKKEECNLLDHGSYGSMMYVIQVWSGGLKNEEPSC